jgi:hypothetical protein
MKYIAIIGGLISIVGQFWFANYHLPAIGGVIAVIGGLIDIW